MTQHDRNLGFCEEANTYCSIAEKEYKQIRAEVIKESFLKDCESCEAHLREQIRSEVIDEAIEKYKKYNCLICKRKDEELCTVGDCTIEFLEQLKEQK